MNELRTVACQRCSRRKQRCDRTLPICSQCAQSNAECRDGKGERIMTRTEIGIVQPKGFVELLEDRLKHLRSLAREQESSAVNPQDDELHGPPGGREGSAEQRDINPDQREQTTTQIDGQARMHGTGSSNSHSRRHSPDLGLLSLSAMAEPNCRAAEFLKGISMPGVIRVITESYGGNPQSTSRIDALWDGISKDIRKSNGQTPDRLYLPKEDALKYVQTYYQVVDYRYPHLPEESVRLGIMAITEAKEADYEATLAHDPAKVFIAYMILAITPLVSDTYPVAQASFISIHILSKALKILDRVFQLEDGVDIIYCLILLVIFSLHSSAAGSTWHLTGVAMKKCIALGFHREVTRTRRDTSEEELEQRRWAFWLCYFLDRLVSCALDRPFSINDRDITIEVQFMESKNLSLLANYSCAPVNFEPYNAEFEDHSNSLLNTLSLRAMTDQIIFTKNDGIDTNSSTPMQQEVALASSILFINGTPISHQPVQLRELMECAQAVIRSLNRRSMQRRSTLSWITGYTAIRASVALLYCLASSRFNQTIRILGDSEIRACEEYVETGMDVLSVVSRQFPIMQDYRSLIGNLRTLINESVLNFSSLSLRTQQMMTSASIIGPNNIYLLVRQIVEILERA